MAWASFGMIFGQHYRELFWDKFRSSILRREGKIPKGDSPLLFRAKNVIFDAYYIFTDSILWFYSFGKVHQETEQVELIELFWWCFGNYHGKEIPNSWLVTPFQDLNSEVESFKQLITRKTLVLKNNTYSYQGERIFYFSANHVVDVCVSFISCDNRFTDRVVYTKYSVLL